MDTTKAEKLLFFGVISVGSMCSVVILVLLVLSGHASRGGRQDGDNARCCPNRVFVVRCLKHPAGVLDPNDRSKANNVDRLRKRVIGSGPIEWKVISDPPIPEEWQNDPCVTTTTVDEHLKIHDRNGNVLFEKVDQGPNAMVELFELRIPLDE